mmetsp:Transcript_67276/g.154137  ORF Transcript_67276/g.154137 Transcript_67276/m.154137 type:complete len:147 (-) Transcript_67276:1046-1486(-)
MGAAVFGDAVVDLAQALTMAFVDGLATKAGVVDSSARKVRSCAEILPSSPRFGARQRHPSLKMRTPAVGYAGPVQHLHEHHNSLLALHFNILHVRRTALVSKAMLVPRSPLFLLIGGLFSCCRCCGYQSVHCWLGHAPAWSGLHGK